MRILDEECKDKIGKEMPKAPSLSEIQRPKYQSREGHIAGMAGIIEPRQELWTVRCFLA